MQFPAIQLCTPLLIFKQGVLDLPAGSFFKTSQFTFYQSPSSATVTFAVATRPQFYQHAWPIDRSRIDEP
jgi:hypothetical protein